MNALIIGLFLPVFSLSAATVRVEGEFTGSEMPAEFLESQYDSIYRLILPGKNPDTATITAIFYSEKRRGDNFRLPEWGGGGCLGKDTIVVRVDPNPFLNQDFFRISVHELVHCILERAYPGIAIPRWMHEGLAMMLSGEVSVDEHLVVSKAIVTHSLLPLDAIDSVNLFPRVRADLAYAQSHLALAFLVKTYSMGSLVEILQATRSNGNIWAGIDTVIGLSQKEFETLYRSYLTERYRLVFLVADTYLFWLALALFAIVGILLSVLRRRTKLARMMREEKEEEEEEKEKQE